MRNNTLGWILLVVWIIFIISAIMFFKQVTKIKETTKLVVYDTNTPCSMLKHASLEYDRPVAVFVTDNIYLTNLDCWLLHPGEKDMSSNNSIVEEYISACGRVIQQEDLNEDGIADREIIWTPILLKTSNDIERVYFYPSEITSGTRHLISKEKKVTKKHKAIPVSI